jgi:hypothetical protein
MKKLATEFLEGESLANRCATPHNRINWVLIRNTLRVAVNEKAMLSEGQQQVVVEALSILLDIDKSCALSEKALGLVVSQHSLAIATYINSCN